MAASQNIVTELYLIRHGETPWTRLKRYQGISETSLTEKGRRQARAVSKSIAKYSIDFLYCSSLKRAQQTAGFISQTTGKRARVDKRINELDFGDWEGKTALQLRKSRDPLFLKWYKGEGVTPPHGESLAGLRKRVGRFLVDVTKRHRGKRVAVVSHGGTIKMMVYHALNLNLRSFWPVRVDPASVTLLLFRFPLTELAFLNDRCHLKPKTRGL